ncbi:DUF1566 domain-containing protein [Aeromonas veronii]|uniref:Lcl C-terminal domain-containing protein n=1 Tax=Aeromonas veronii TaxID=654 RepID=UPI003F7997B7
MMKKLFLPIAALTITACQPEPNVALRIDCGEFNDQGVAITLNGKPIGDCPLDIMTHAGQTDISVNKTFADASYLEGSQSLMLAENVNKRVQFESILSEQYDFNKATTVETAQAYLTRYPQGKYVQQVKARIETFPLIANRYYDNLDGTVFDKQTQLVWMRCSLGQSWDGKTCNGEAKPYTWEDATKLTHNFAGSTAWRLPTIEELDSLVYCSKGRKPSARPNGEYVKDTNGECLGDNYQEPTINIRAFPNTPYSWHWSSSPYARNSNDAGFVDFGSGFVGYHNKDRRPYVRLVRAGQ